VSGGQGFSLSNGLTLQNICAELATVKLVAKVALMAPRHPLAPKRATFEGVLTAT